MIEGVSGRPGHSHLRVSRPSGRAGWKTRNRPMNRDTLFIPAVHGQTDRFRALVGSSLFAITAGILLGGTDQ